MFLQRPDGPVLAPADFMLELLAPITYLHRRDVPASAPANFMLAICAAAKVFATSRRPRLSAG